MDTVFPPYSMFCLGRAKSLAVGIVLSLVASGPALSETATVLQSNYKALADSRDNEMETCGILWDAGVQKMDNSLYLVEGSINTYFIVDKVPSVMMKVRSVAWQDGKSELVTIKSARLRFGTLETSKFKQAPAEDGKSRLLMQVDANRAMEWIETVMRVDGGFWVMVDGSHGLRVSFRMPAFAEKDRGTLNDYFECQAAAAKKAREWLSKQ